VILTTFFPLFLSKTQVTYIQDHDRVDILSVTLSDENTVLLDLSDGSTIDLECLDGLQLLHVYDCIVYA
jgi:hypothetical protein